MSGLIASDNNERHFLLLDIDANVSNVSHQSSLGIDDLHTHNSLARNELALFLAQMKAPQV